MRVAELFGIMLATLFLGFLAPSVQGGMIALAAIALSLQLWIFWYLWRSWNEDRKWFVFVLVFLMLPLFLNAFLIVSSVSDEIAFQLSL